MSLNLKFDPGNHLWQGNQLRDLPNHTDSWTKYFPSALRKVAQWRFKRFKIDSVSRSNYQIFWFCWQVYWSNSTFSLWSVLFDPVLRRIANLLYETHLIFGNLLFQHLSFFPRLQSRRLSSGLKISLLNRPRKGFFFSIWETDLERCEQRSDGGTWVLLFPNPPYAPPKKTQKYHIQ